MPIPDSLQWTRRLPTHVLNGLSVSIGIALIHLFFALLAGASVAQLATSGAVLASLADLPNPIERVWRRVLAAALLGCFSALVVTLLQPYPLALGGGIAWIAFVATMTLAWGPRAGPISFSPVLALLFTMVLPPTTPTAALQVVGWNLLGGLTYLCWSLGANTLLQPRYRTLALARAVLGMARLMRSRAALLEEGIRGSHGSENMQAWIQEEASLAERLQSARDLLFAAPDIPEARRETAMLLRVIDLRDILLTSWLDLDLLGHDSTGRLLRERLASGLRQIALALEDAEDVLRGRAAPLASSDRALILDPLLGHAHLSETDLRARLIPALEDRLQHLAENLAEIHALLRGESQELPLSRSQLQLFVAPEGWPLDALRFHLSLRSPVFRHALRAALALGVAYFIARALPWTAHPHWLVISVAVVLRGSLEQTLARRDARVAGTAVGCLVVLWLAHVHSPLFLNVVFLIAVGVAHAYINIRYLVTAAAVTVMALLQTHLLNPGAGFPIIERLADTLLGAALAWGFSYVLPSWERRSLPLAIERVLQSLQEYAHLVLDPPANQASVMQRLSRRKAYDALGAVAAALQRSTVEPRHVQPPKRELLALLDHAQRLMAHLSAIRLMLLHRHSGLAQPETTQALQAADKVLQAVLSLRATRVEVASRPSAPEVELPLEPPRKHMLPWLHRRLEISIQEGRHAVSSASQALALLEASRSPSPPSSSQ